MAVVDSGWDAELVDDRVLAGRSLVGDTEFAPTPNADYHDRLGHGTKCAQRILNVAPRARVLPIRIFDRRLEASTAQLTSAIDCAVDAGVQIINLSLCTHLLVDLLPLYAACERAVRHGAIVIGAGSNTGGISFPAAFANCIGVAAGWFGTLLDYEYRPADLLECRAHGAHDTRQGGAAKPTTSLATATLSGIVALLVRGHGSSELPVVRSLLREFAREVSTR